MMQNITARGNPLWLLTRPVFFAIDIVGAMFITVSLWVEIAWAAAALAAVGSAFLAIGLSLPIALYYQLMENSFSSNILDTCNRSGIKAIYEGRHGDSQRFRDAVDLAFVKSNEVRLLGVAFRSLFDPSGEYSPQTRQKLSDPRDHLRVLLLNPDSSAAAFRANIENAVTANIRFTLDTGIPATVQERFKKASLQNPTFDQKLFDAKNNPTEEAVKSIAKLINCQVRVYDTHPIAFLMIFGGSVFTEQYHFGRPRNHHASSCIGKHVPVVQDVSGAKATKFLMAHYEVVWAEAEERTYDVFKKALAEFA